MSDDFTSVQFEYLLPWQLRQRLAARPVAYLPLGTYEWHGEHLPVGLDSLTAHGLCQRAAMREGGIVFPPLYYGCGGGHGSYPWTVIKDTSEEIESQLDFTLQRLQVFGFRLVVLFSGHFAGPQLAMIDKLAAAWNGKHGPLRVFATAVNRIEGLPIGPDHAALFETTLLAGLHSELVQLGRLPSAAEAPVPAGEDSFGAQRHEPSHPLYGIFGPDPRLFDQSQAAALVENSVDWLVTQVKAQV